MARRGKMMRDKIGSLRYNTRNPSNPVWIRLMDNLRISLLSLVALVIALGAIGVSLVFAPHLTVLVATIASLTYIGGMVFMTIGR